MSEITDEIEPGHVARMDTGINQLDLEGPPRKKMRKGTKSCIECTYILCSSVQLATSIMIISSALPPLPCLALSYSKPCLLRIPLQLFPIMALACTPSHGLVDSDIIGCFLLTNLFVQVDAGKSVALLIRNVRTSVMSAMPEGQSALIRNMAPYLLVAPVESNDIVCVSESRNWRRPSLVS